MSANKQEQSTGSTDASQGDASDAMTAEIERTMAEAEAAVSAMNEDADDEADIEIEDHVPDDDDPEDEDDAVDFDALLEAKDQEIAALKDKWLRAVADHDNYKKRVKRDIDDTVARSVQNLLMAFLPTVDNLERALEIATPGEDGVTGNAEQVLKGLTMVRDEFLSALKKNNIVPVPAVGVPFDPAIHDALQQIDSPDHEPGVVIREFEKGYKFGERLLRPARVIIAGSGSGGSQES